MNKQVAQQQGCWQAKQTVPRLRLAVLLWAFILTAGLAGAAEAWPVPNALWRVRVERTKDAPWPAPVGVVEVAPCGLDPDRCRVTAVAGDGTKVNSQVFAVRHEPVKIFLDTTGSAAGTFYYLYFEDSEVPNVQWSPQGGLILETRRLKPGARADTWEQAWKLWNASAPILGRSPAGTVFHGHHPHGDTTNFVGRFSGWFTVPAADEYQFAIATTDPAFLRINGKLVAERGARATGGLGARGQYNGKIQLRAGRNQLEYLCVHTLGEWIAEVAWQPPDTKNLVPMPAKAFEPVARMEVVDFEAAPGGPARVYFDWQLVEHNLVDDFALVDVRFRALPDRSGREWRWQFEEGANGTGRNPLRVFMGEGRHKVELEVRENGRRLGGLAQTIAVHPQYRQSAEWQDTLFERQKQELLARDFSRTPPEDLAALVKCADRLGDHDLLTHAGISCLRRREEFPPDLSETFLLLGAHFEDALVRDYPLAEQAWRAAFAKGPPALRARAGLRLAQCLINVSGKPEEALKLLAGLEAGRLSDTEARQRKLAEGDALLLQGKVPEATRCYESAGSLVSELNRTQNMRSRARLESARDYARRGEFGRAEILLQMIEWETPLDRLSMETGVARLQIYLSRKEYPRALTRCQQLLPLATVDTHRADLLYYLAEIQRGMGRVAEAQAALAKLVADYPYSEAAAKAKDQYGTAPAPK